MFRVGILEVWKRNVLIDASSKEHAVDSILSSKVPATQESLTYLRVLDPDEWIVESTEPEEILAEALAVVGALCSVIQTNGGDTREALEQAKAWEDRFLAFAQEANEPKKEGDADTTNSGPISGDSDVPPQAGIWDLGL